MAKRCNDYGTGIPRHEIEALARALLPTMQAFFESEEGQREFGEKAQAEEGAERNGLAPEKCRIYADSQPKNRPGRDRTLARPVLVDKHPAYERFNACVQKAKCLV